MTSNKLQCIKPLNGFRKFFNLLLLVALTATTVLNADELSDAYQKEYAFLKAQKSELTKRISKEKKTQESKIYAMKQRVTKLQNNYISLSKELEQYEVHIEKSTQMLSDKTSNKEITASVIMQAKSLLSEYKINVDDSKEAKAVDVMNRAFSDASALYKTLSSSSSEKGKFYLEDGTTTIGDIIKIGNIAAYGISNKISVALAPAGNGEYKAWNVETSADAKAFQNKNYLKDMKIFIYENLDKDIEYTKEKTIQETLEGGGTIGYIILGLGALGLLLLLLRVLFLSQASSNVDKITNVVVSKVESGKGSEALEAIKSFEGSTARVIKATLRSINKDREHVEDIVMESILNESTSLDRFGNFILVLAAVAPLLGLLGTVTGMIATFDIITTHGTGDPKLLSGGISEALVTTMLGLVVAIPLLLLGNLMGGWAQNIKDSMEQSALHIVNLFEKNRA